MTLEQLKERIAAQCNQNGIFPTKIILYIENDLLNCLFFPTSHKDFILIDKPNTDLLLESVDLECREIKPRQSSATNVIDE